MDINLSLSPAPSITSNYLVVAVYKTTAPAVVVDYKFQPAPHTAIWNIAFTDLDPGTYQVITYEHNVNTPGGSIRHNFFYDPSFQSAQLRTDLFLKVGTTPNFNVDATDFHDTGDDQSLAGWEYEVDLRQSFGEMQPGVEVQKFTDGFGLLVSGQTFQLDEIYILRFYPKITVVTPAVVSANLFTDVLIVTADRVLTAADMGKAIHIVGTNPALTLTLPDIATVAANKPLIISSNGGNHKNVTIAAASGQAISWSGVDNLTLVNLGQCEIFWPYRWTDPITPTNLLWRVINASPGIQQVGEIIDQYSLVPLNTIYANGDIISRTTYRRLWAWVQLLDASMLITLTQWNTGTNDQAKYNTGDGSTTFGLPRLFTRGFSRAVNSTIRKAGSMELEMIGPHYHQEGTEPLNTAPYQRGSVHAVRARDPTSGVVPILSSTDVNIGTENRPANDGVYKLIRI